MTVRVVTDSLAAIPAGVAREAGIEVVSLYINDGETNQRELDMDVASFYRRLEDMRTLPTSSQPSVESFLEAFSPAIEHGTEVLGVFVSTQDERHARGGAHRRRHGSRRDTPVPVSSSSTVARTRWSRVRRARRGQRGQRGREPRSVHRDRA